MQEGVTYMFQNCEAKPSKPGYEGRSENAHSLELFAGYNFGVVDPAELPTAGERSSL